MTYILFLPFSLWSRGQNAKPRVRLCLCLCLRTRMTCCNVNAVWNAVNKCRTVFVTSEVDNAGVKGTISIIRTGNVCQVKDLGQCNMTLIQYRIFSNNNGNKFSDTLSPGILSVFSSFCCQLICWTHFFWAWLVHFPQIPIANGVQNVSSFKHTILSILGLNFSSFFLFSLCKQFTLKCGKSFN